MTKWLTTKEVAARLGYKKVDSVEGLFKSKQLIPRQWKPRGMKLVSEKELDDFMNRHTPTRKVA
jgi:hypothetical protein